MTTGQTFCVQCGAQLSAGAPFCESCGARVVVSPPANQPVDQAPRLGGGSGMLPVLGGVIAGLIGIAAILFLGPRYLGLPAPSFLPGGSMAGSPTPEAAAANARPTSAPPTTAVMAVTSTSVLVTPTSAPLTPTRAPSTSTPAPTSVPATSTPVLARPAEPFSPRTEIGERALAILDSAFTALYRRDEATFRAAFNRSGQDNVADGLWSARQSVQRFRAALAPDPFPVSPRQLEVLIRVDFELTLTSGAPRKSQGIVRLVPFVPDGNRYLIESIETTVAPPDMGPSAPAWALPSGGAVPRALGGANYLLKSLLDRDRTAFNDAFTDSARQSAGQELWSLRQESPTFNAYLALDDPVRFFGDAPPGSPPGTSIATIRVIVDRSTAEGRPERQTLDLKMISREMDFLVDGFERVNG